MWHFFGSGSCNFGNQTVPGCTCMLIENTTWSFSLFVNREDCVLEVFLHFLLKTITNYNILSYFIGI